MKALFLTSKDYQIQLCKYQTFIAFRQNFFRMQNLMHQSTLFWFVFRIMNGINAPKVVECFGSDGCRYRQLAKSGNDDLRQDAV